MRRSSAHRVRLLVGRVLLLGGFFLVWHVLTQTGVLPRFFFGTPVTVLGNAARWFTSGKIYRHLGITLIETVLAFGLGTALGLVQPAHQRRHGVRRRGRRRVPGLIRRRRLPDPPGRRSVRHQYGVCRHPRPHRLCAAARRDRHPARAAAPPVAARGDDH